MTGPCDIPVRYPSRYPSPVDRRPELERGPAREEPGNGGASLPASADRRCSVCQVVQVSARARYCSDACKQHAYRLRQPSLAPPALDAVTADLRQRKTLVAHTIYECPSCETRYLAERRCPDCHLFCRRLGLGGPCPHCDDLVLVAEILVREVSR
jgi:hypothetical protein